MSYKDEPGKEKLVIDTSLWVASMLTKAKDGAANAAIRKALENGTPVGSRETMKELESVLMNKPFLDKHGVSRVTLEERAKELAFARAVTQLVPITRQVNLCRDPTDDKFLSVAINAGAKQVLTYDKDIRVLETLKGIEMYKAKEFLDRERQLDIRRVPFLNQSSPQPAAKRESHADEAFREWQEKQKNRKPNENTRETEAKSRDREEHERDRTPWGDDPRRG